MNPGAAGTKALVFDVFGTVVDWHGSVAREVRALARSKGLRVNAAKFAKAWRAGYRPAMDRVLRGETIAWWEWAVSLGAGFALVALVWFVAARLYHREQLATSA